MDRLRTDVTHAWRGMRSRAASTTATVLVLALGIGLTAAMFALADPFLLRPLPYPHPDELAILEIRVQRRGVIPDVPTLLAWQGRRDLFRSIAAYRLGDSVRLRTPGRSIVLQSVDVSNNLLQVLGVSTSAFDGLERQPGQQEVPIILTEEARQRLFGGSSVVGMAFPRHDGGTARITSILPYGFLFPRARVRPRIDALSIVDTRSLVDIERSPSGDSFSSRPFTAIARLEEKITPEMAQTALRAGIDNSALAVDVHSLTSYMRRGLQPLALGALIAGLLILLICAGNLGNLLLARGAYRAREFATREAIGGDRWDLIRLVLVELGLLTTAGIAFGLAVAHAALSLAAVVVPAEYSALGTPAVTGRVMVFSAFIGAIVVGLGLVPSWAAWRTASGVLASRFVLAETRRARVLRFVIAAGQSAIGLVLLSAAALLVRSYVNLASQDTGFVNDAGVVSVSYPPGHLGPKLQADIEASLERLRRVRGIVDVAAATGPMADGLRSPSIVRVDGRPELVERKYVSPGYFQTVGTPIIAGRVLTVEDGQTYVVVNEAFAKRHWPNGKAIGRQLLVGVRPAEVVGVVRNTFDLALDTPPGPTMFMLLKNPALALRVNYALRFASSFRPAADVLAREITAVNPDAFVIDASSLGTRLADTVRERSFATLVLTFFAVSGIGVCSAGLIGIVSFVVARRTREIAIRVALGATPFRVRFLVLREALAAAATGTTVGILAGRWISQTLKTLLFGVEAGDWVTMAGAALILIVVVGVASVVPANRAVRLSPTDALRVE